LDINFTIMTYYTLNTIDVSSEYFENEVLAINLKTGNYFSLRGTAFVFWKLITEGYSLESSLTEICNHFSVENATISPLFEKFTQQLLQNELIAKSDSNPTPTSNEWINTVTKDFTPPVLECYTDMQDLLLFDPIHDVDTQVGWPKKSEESSN
jgi:hypothetical protein